MTVLPDVLYWNRLEIKFLFNILKTAFQSNQFWIRLLLNTLLDYFLFNIPLFLQNDGLSFKHFLGLIKFLKNKNDLSTFSDC